ncbi:MAG: response regulator transcription factor [Planctomycetota bacterium]
MAKKKKKKAAPRKKAVKRKRPVKKKKAKAAKKPPAAKLYLTPREGEIFRLLSLGCTVKEAASILKVAPSTADNHKARLMAKLGTDKAALLTRLAIRMGVSNMKDKLSPAEKRRSGRKRDGWN